MTILPVENTILPQIINDWPHQDCARRVVNMMMDQGYSAKSIGSTIFGLCRVEERLPERRTDSGPLR